MQEKPTKKTWETPQFTILSRGYVNSGSLVITAHEASFKGKGAYIATLTGTGVPAMSAADFGKTGNGYFQKSSQLVS